MMLRNSAAMLVILAGTSMWGQSPAGASAPKRQPVFATSNAEGVAAANRAKATANQNLQEMGATITKMQALLKQMRAHSSSKDPAAKANLEMWTLMLDQLDKQYEQMRVATRQREELEARRAALYKQADERAAEAAKRAREAAAAAAEANKQAPAATAPAAEQTSTTAPTSSTSPN